MSDIVYCTTCDAPMRQQVRLLLPPATRTGPYAGPPPFTISELADGSCQAVRTDGAAAGTPPFICRECIIKMAEGVSA